MFRHLVATTARRAGNASIAATRATPPRQGPVCRCLAATPEPPQRTTPPQPKRSKPEALLALARVDAPAGTLLLYWPGAWSIALAAPPGALPDLKLLALFGAGSIVMRGAGCTINDILDRDVDGAVERTKTRPLAANELSVQEATAFLAVQLTCGLGVLTQLDLSSIALGACSVPLVLTYPLAKRFFAMPQLVLGLTFNWGALLGYSAATGGTVDYGVCLPLYGGCVAWTLLYDTLYAHQDKKDDSKLKLRSSALTIGDQNTPLFLRVCGVATVSGLGLAGFNAGFHDANAWPFYASLATFAAHLTWQVETADLNDPANLGARFRSNGAVAPVVLVGIAAATLNSA